MTNWKPKKKWYIDNNGKRRKVGSWGYVRNPVGRKWAKNKERDILAGVEKKIGKAGHVYILSLGLDNLYKVGCTCHIGRRVKELGASNPRVKCIWSAWVKDMKDTESKIHKLLKESQIDREIFELSEKQILHVNGFVNNIKEKYA
jgi:T5orf172 domain